MTRAVVLGSLICLLSVGGGCSQSGKSDDPVAEPTPKAEEEKPAVSGSDVTVTGPARPAEPSGASSAPNGGGTEALAQGASGESRPVRDNSKRVQLENALGLPFYPGARHVPSLSTVSSDFVRVILVTDEPISRVVRFYEQHTGKVAQTTELSDGDIHDIVLDSRAAGIDGREPVHGVQVRSTPDSLRSDRVSGRTSVILFKRLAP